MKLTCSQCHLQFDLDAETPPPTAVCPGCGTKISLRVDDTDSGSSTGVKIGSQADTLGVELVDDDGTAAGDIRGLRIGSYEVLEEISRGAMGVVYRAEQRELKRIVAIKVLLAGQHASTGQVARFRREAQAAGRLRHPCIVPIHEVGTFEGKHYYTMPYIEGEPLNQLIREGKLDSGRWLEIVRDVAEALHYAHSQGVVHRDIKPSNIMIDTNGVPQIMDFGLAKQLDSDTKFTKTGTTIGTPAYMPPEQASGDMTRVDQRADVYSLGAVLYEMLAGKAPFTGDTMMNVVMQVLNEEPVPPRKLNPRIHRDIQTIILKTMDKEPNRRYQTAEELADDIRRYSAGEAISAKPAGVLYRARRYIKRHRGMLVPLLTIVVVSLLATGVASWSADWISRVSEEAGHQPTRHPNRTTTDQEATPLVVIDDGFGRAELGPQWAVGEGEWRIAEGQLAVTASEKAHLLNTNICQGNVTLEFTVQALPTDKPPHINCFFGRSRNDSYLVTFGGVEGKISLRRRRVEAEVDAAPIVPESPYRITFERRGTTLRFVAAHDDDEWVLEYSSPEVIAFFFNRRGTKGGFQVGFDTWSSNLRLDNVKLMQEVLPSRPYRLQVADNLLYSGEYDIAVREYDAIIKQMQDHAMKIQAHYRLGVALESVGRREEALQEYLVVSKQEANPELAALAELFARNRERRFFGHIHTAEAQPAAAVEDLEVIQRNGYSLDPACVWQFAPAIRGCIGHQALDQALGILRIAKFGEERVGLYQLVQSLGKRLDADVAREVASLGQQYVKLGQREKLKEIYEAYPTNQLTRSFESAIRDAIKAEQYGSALELLHFAGGRLGTTQFLTQRAVEIAKAFSAQGQFDRVINVHKAYEQDDLIVAFDDALRQMIAKKALEHGLEILQYASQKLPEKAALLVTRGNAPAPALIAAFAAAGQFDNAKAVHQALPDDRLLPGLLGATSKAAQAGKYEEAVALLQYCAKNFTNGGPQLTSAALSLAGHAIGAKEYKRLIEAYEIASDPKFAPSFAKAAQSCAEAKDFRQALDLLGYAWDAGLAKENRYLTQAVAQVAQRILAAEDFESLIRLHRRCPDPQTARVFVAAIDKTIQAEQRDTALEIFTYARAAFASDYETLRPLAAKLAAIYGEPEGRDALAAAYAAILTELEGQSTERAVARLELGDAYCGMEGALPQALSAYGKLLAEESASPELKLAALLRTACIHLHRKDGEKATEGWRKVLASAGEDQFAAAVGAFMLDQTTSEDFAKWCAQNKKLAAKQRADYFVGAKLAATSQPEAVGYLKKSLTKGTLPHWTDGLAREAIAEAKAEAEAKAKAAAEAEAKAAEPKPEPKPEPEPKAGD